MLALVCMHTREISQDNNPSPSPSPAMTLQSSSSSGPLVGLQTTGAPWHFVRQGSFIDCEKTNIVSISGHKKMHVKRKSPVGLSSFRKTKGLLVKEAPDNASSYENYWCPILEEKPEDVDTICNPK